MSTDTLGKMVNYLVPASGTTRGYTVSRELSATPHRVDFTTISLDGTAFRPSGVFIDNSQGTGPITILVNELSYRITCPAGAALQTQFPAPMSMSVAITGEGQATMIFVDFPTIPFLSDPNAAGSVTIADGANVALGSLDSLAVADPAASASVIALLKGLIYTTRKINGVDSDGEYLPDEFESLPQTLTYDGGGNLQTTARSDGINTWTQTLTYTGANVTGISAWVKS